MELKDLVGDHEFDAVDFVSESDDCANSMRFRLDGVTYVATEDSQDGYRSCMRDLKVFSNNVIRNTFKPVSVIAKYNSGNRGDDSCILELFDKETGLLLLEVGTDHNVEYYPMFVSVFYADAMSK